MRCSRAASGVAPTTLTSLALCNNFTNLAMTGAFAAVARDNRLITRAELDSAARLGPVDPLTGLPPGLQQVFFRGDVQRNTAVRLSQSYSPTSRICAPAWARNFASRFQFLTCLFV